METNQQRPSGDRMIPLDYIKEWSSFAPWQQLKQIEQDLIITKALMLIYSHPTLRELVAMRGGTALNKLFSNDPFRYSEDIDLVLTSKQSVGKIIDMIRSRLDPLLGTPSRRYSRGISTITYKTTSNEGFPLKLKIETNCREYFSVLGYQEYPLNSESSWTQGNVMIKAFTLEELLGTKLRALYQRRKGRDLFDLYIFLKSYPTLDINKIINCFKIYTELDGPITGKLFLENLRKKLEIPEFRNDIVPLLPLNRPAFDPDVAFEYLRVHLLEML